MSKSTTCTVEIITERLRSTVSEKRFRHSLGVAQTTSFLLEYYGCQNYDRGPEGLDAGCICGLAHDLARELTDEQILSYCDENSIELDEEYRRTPVLAHGCVSAHMLRTLIGDYPSSWEKAIRLHTVGDEGMDDLALALFAADFIEPGRTFLTSEQRNRYLAAPSLEECEYLILCDIMDHWEKKGTVPASGSVRLKAELERHLGK